MKNIFLTLLVLFVSWVAISQTLVVKNFGLPNSGSNPGSELYFDGTFLYGTAVSGGASNYGTVYKVRPDGTDFQSLHHFGGADGAMPEGALIMDGIYLYGTTKYGGTLGNGVVYKISPDGTDYNVIHNFTGGSGGGHPWGELILESGYLYGTTQTEGTGDKGIIYKIHPDGTGFQKIFDFGGVTSGSFPVSGLIFDSGFLYGTTTAGGVSDKGVIFKIQPDGGGFVKIHDFNGAEGEQCLTQLTFDGTYLYGSTLYGGSNGGGTTFRIKPDGTEFSILIHFNEATTGARPYGDVLLDGPVLYGTLRDGGGFVGGVVYKMNIDGSGYVKLKNFSTLEDLGINPTAGVISDGNFLYGCTTYGGTLSEGTLFKICLYHPVVEATATPQWICNGGALTLTGSGSGNLSYTWTNGAVDGVPFYPTSTNSYMLTATDSMGCAGEDYVNVFVYPCLGIDENSEYAVKISPNPSNGIFSVYVGEANKSVSVKIWNEGMKEVYSETGKYTDASGSISLNVSHLNAGIYFIEILNNKSSGIVKLLIF